MTATPEHPCPASWRTRRLARRMAWYTADRASVKPLPPVQCDRCGQWHLHPDDPGRSASAAALYRRAAAHPTRAVAARSLIHN
jgi:hypothetical protein